MEFKLEEIEEEDSLFTYDSKLAEEYEKQVFFQQLKNRATAWRGASIKHLFAAIFNFMVFILFMVGLVVEIDGHVSFKIVANMACILVGALFLIDGIKDLSKSTTTRKLALYYETFQTSMYNLYRDVDLYPADFDLAVNAREIDLSMYKFER